LSVAMARKRVGPSWALTGAREGAAPAGEIGSPTGDEAMTMVAAADHVHRGGEKRMDKP